MREQADPQALIPRLPELVNALKKAVKTDIPIDQLDELLGLASQVDTTNISSYVFQPPLYGSETLRGAPVYKMFPNVSRIRSAVKGAFKADPADEDLRERLAEEAATLWVVSAFNDRTRGPELATYLDQKGIPASAPRARDASPSPRRRRSSSITAPRPTSATRSRTWRRRSRSRSRPRSIRRSAPTSS